MKPVILLCFVATNAMALDIDQEWAKFSNDFERLKQRPVVVASRSTSVPVVDKSIQLPAKNTQDNTLQQVDPKSPERLGHKLSDPEMRDRVVEVYNKPNAVVYSATLN
jgi:hypothetical protein